jgi:hypothetical protein
MLVKRMMAVALCLTLAAPAFARNRAGDNWYFGQHCGITFVFGDPEPLEEGGQLSTVAGCSTISTPAGQPLFYTDGLTVWDRYHAQMANGDGLLGGRWASQSALIVPKPGSSTVFYVFTVPEAPNDTVGLNYSVVDMSLMDGLGAVVADGKNTKIMNSCSEQLTAVSHANRTDIWVIARPAGTNQFHAFLVTSEGVNHTPTISSAGTSLDFIFHTMNHGCLKASPTGDALAMTYYADRLVELYDFNNATGEVTNAVSVDDLSLPYGVEFSVDGKVLYVMSVGKALYQYDLTAGDIAGSKVEVGTPTQGGGLQLGPDGRIYVALLNEPRLGVIESPTRLGVACSYNDHGPSTPGLCASGLPGFVQTFFAAEDDLTMDKNATLTFSATSFSTLYNRWTGLTLATVKIVSVPTHGVLALSGTPLAVDDTIEAADLDDVTYAPATDYVGNDTFSWSGKPADGAYGLTITFAIEVQNTPPSAPVATAATNVTQTSFTATWNASADATSYRLDVAMDEAFTEFVPDYESVVVSGTSHDVTDLAEGQTYYYRVRAANDFAESNNSNVIAVTCEVDGVLEVVTTITTTYGCGPMAAGVFAMMLFGFGSLTGISLRRNGR